MSENCLVCINISGHDIKIQCRIDDTFEKIFKKLANKIGKDISEYTFVNGSKTIA